MKPGPCVMVASLLLAAACTNQQDKDRGLTASDRQALNARAAANAQCKFEDQFACNHLIENRILLARFFAPKGLGRLDENEKTRGRNITTNYVVDAAAGIKQCLRVDRPALPLVKGMEFAGRKWQVMGTSPLDENSACYITPEVSEAS